VNDQQRSQTPELATLLCSIHDKSSKGDKGMLKLGDLPDDLPLSQIPALAQHPELAEYKTLGDLRRNPPRAAPLPRVPHQPGKAPFVSYETKGATPTREQYGAFDAIYTFFNAELFNGELPPVMLTFSRRARHAGHFIGTRWQSASDENRCVGEIAFNPDTVREPREMAQTIVHEMCHLWQFVNGTASRGSYHNKIWATHMESIGLMPSNTGKPGGKKTGQSVMDYVIDGGPFDKAFAKLPDGALLPFITVVSDTPTSCEGAENLEPEEPPKDTSKSKYTCPVCSFNCWAKLIAEGEEPLIHGRHGVMVLAAGEVDDEVDDVPPEAPTTSTAKSTPVGVGAADAEIVGRPDLRAAGATRPARTRSNRAA